MKAILTIALTLFTITLWSQDKVHTFESSQLKINHNGQPIETSTTTPSRIVVDIESGVLTLETENVEVREMLKERTSFTITKQMGQMRSQYSLHLDEFILAHFYTEIGMVIFTRTDAHPLQWGIQFLNARKL